MCFLGASNLENEKRILPSLLGDDDQHVVSTFHLDEVPDKFEVSLGMLEEHFQFSSSVMLERKKLRDRIQRPGKLVFSCFAAPGLFLCPQHCT